MPRGLLATEDGGIQPMYLTHEAAMDWMALPVARASSGAAECQTQWKMSGNSNQRLVCTET